MKIHATKSAKSSKYVFADFKLCASSWLKVEKPDGSKWLWGAVLLSILLQVAVIYIPFLQAAFSTVSLSAGDWLRCAVVASSVLWLRELSKLFTRLRVNTKESARWHFARM